MNPSFTNNDILAVLKEARLFAQFSNAQLKQLISSSSVESFAPNQTIIEQGVQNDKIFILLEGQVSVYTDNEFILNLCRQGDLVGEMSVITKLPTTAKVVAEEPAELFSISSENIDQSSHAELKSTVYKLFLDILTEKLTMTTKQVIGFQATTEALTVKKQELAESETVIQQKEAILQQVLGSMSDGVVVMEKEGHLLHINNAFKEMTGGIDIPEDFSQWPDKMGLYQTDEKTLYTPEQLPMTTIFQGKPVDSEEILIRNSQLPEGVWLQASSRMLTSDDNPTSQGAVVVFRDFTKKKLEEKALIEAKESAEAAAMAKSNFLAVMSHELRTPLNGIMGMTDLMAGTTLDIEQESYLDTIKASSEKLLGLVRNILDFSNLDSSNLPLKNEPFSLKECFNEASEAFSPLARKKGLQFNTSLSSEIPEKMMGNARGVLQIIRNLTENAVKFSKEGEINLSATLASRQGNLFSILLSVEDTGIGIDENRLGDLFQPFSQGDSSISRSFDGAGIGLSLCKKYVDRMDGNIRVESQVGKGSRFEVQLKLAAADITNESDIEVHDNLALSPDSSFSVKYPLDILVAEDNAMNQKLIKKVLEKLGYTPVIANNGLEAVECNREKEFDLILMDLHMPDMGGLEASQIINEEKKGANKPKIIALTANVSDEVRDSCMKAGMTDYTTKPLKINHLMSMLQKL